MLLPLALVFHVFGTPEKLDQPYDEVSFTVVLFGTLAWIAVLAFITRFRYQRISVSR